MSVRTAHRRFHPGRRRGSAVGVIGRVVIDDVRPRTPRPEHPAKATLRERVEVSADIFRDGHDILAGQVRWRAVPAKTAKGRPERAKWQTAPMTALGNDRWVASIEPTTLGMHELVVEGWTD